MNELSKVALISDEKLRAICTEVFGADLTPFNEYLDEWYHSFVRNDGSQDSNLRKLSFDHYTRLKQFLSCLEHNILPTDVTKIEMKIFSYQQLN